MVCEHLEVIAKLTSKVCFEKYRSFHRCDVNGKCKNRCIVNEVTVKTAVSSNCFPWSMKTRTRLSFQTNQIQTNTYTVIHTQREFLIDTIAYIKIQPETVLCVVYVAATKARCLQLLYSACCIHHAHRTRQHQYLLCTLASTKK